MNQTCKVCGEPAAGFHFGAFTCEGCKSFFGRSYNNLSSISECKNNGECTINKKNRTACKACRLRKCLMVGMSKSGSRYGRRSNWFKIHCLLQEQQQQAAAAHASASLGNSRKTPPPSSASINMLSHSTYPQALYPRPTTKEELMLLGFEDYNNSKRPSASPSVSSPDSHNSDSSVEVGDRRQSLLRQTQAQQQSRAQLPAPPFNKELFLPLTFPGLMPPPGFLPPSHLMFPGYHPALYAQHQGLLKPAVDSVALLNSAQTLANNNSRFVPNNNNNTTTKSAEEITKRYLDAVLKCSQSEAIIKSDDEEEMENGEVVVSMTPPSSPPTASVRNSHSSTSVMASTSTLRNKKSSISGSQDSPMDLSLRSFPKMPKSLSKDSHSSDHSQNGDVDTSGDEDGDRRPSSSESAGRPGSRDNEDSISDNGPQFKSPGTKPLDLTTKI